MCMTVLSVRTKLQEEDRLAAYANTEKMNLTLMTDLYELTMMQGYYKTGNKDVVVFDAFYRTNPFQGGYAIMAGLDQVIDYIKNLHFDNEDIEYLRSLNMFDEDFLSDLSDFHFAGDVYAIPEGTIIFPREPLVKIIAPAIEAQLLETALLNIVNHQCLIATKAARVCDAADGDGVMEFGLRRAQGPDAGTYGARAAVIGGCGIPVAMIFIANQNGSHNPYEEMQMKDFMIGTDLLWHTVKAYD